MTSQIKNFFTEIENLIELQLRDGVQNQLEINQKFKEGKKLIDQLEEDDEEQFGLFRYKFHTEYARYLKAIGDVDNASKQKNLAKKYEKYMKNSEETDTYKQVSLLFAGATLDNINPEDNPKENSMPDSLEEHLNSIQNILEDKVVDDIRQAFKQFDKIPETFEDYKNMVNSEINILKVVDGVINEMIISNDNVKRQVLRSLESLKSSAVEISYSKRIFFIQCVLNSPDKKEILYSNTTFSEEGINKRFKELALHFHPDKTSQIYTPYRLQNKDKNLGVDLFRFIQEYKEELLSKLEIASKEEGRLNFHEKKGNELWKITIDYRNAAKGQWDKLKLLKKEDIKDEEREELERCGEYYGMLAYHEYQAACKVADRAKNLKKQVKLRGNMALCLHISKNSLEAQLRALSAILLLLYKSQKLTQQDLIEAKRIFDKIKGGNSTTEETIKLNAKVDIKDNSNNSSALIKAMDQEFSFIEKKAFQSLYNDEISKLGNELIFNPDRSLVCYQANNEEILRAKKRASTYKAAGVTSIGTGTIMGGGIAVGAAVNIYNAVFVIGVTTVGGPLLLLGGLATFGLGIWGGRSLWKKGTVLIQEPEIREKLNQIMIDALEAYDKGEHQNFLEALSKEYAANTSLLKLRKRDDIINPEDIIDKLLSHGFRSDGIAYLLNLLGEALNGGKLNIEGKTKKDLKALAINVFNAVLNEKLKAEAIKLDNHIHELRKKSFLSQVRKVTDFIFFNEHSGIAKEYKDDAQEMPFQSRLEEICNIARINLTIIDIIDAGPEEIERAVNTIKDIRYSVNSNYQFIGTVKWRLEILEDLLWVINGEESQEEVPKLSLITFHMESNQDTDGYLDYLNEKLKQISTKQEELNLYNSIAAYHEQLAEKKNKVNQLESLCHWQAAQMNYENAYKLNPKNLDAVLGFAKCLLKLSKYDRITKLSIASPGLTSLSEYWLFCGIAYCKQVDYKKANECIIESLRIDPGNKLASEQRELLKKLMVKGNSTIDYRINRYEKEKVAVKFEIDYLKNSHCNSRPTYNILSIDGGGIRGILPTLWLSEIEHRAHRPISHLFNMITGTSTGGIVAAGLSAPSWEKSYYHGCDSVTDYFYIYSDTKPRVSATELLSLYQNQAKDLIELNSKKERLFGKYFNKIRLNKALTELVIPAFNSKQPYLFTRYDARIDESKNDTFFDTLMATTASPTISSPFNIKGKGDFLDGGVCLNNPAMTAYYEAVRYKVANEKIFVLSMGTGSYTPDPLNPGLYWDQLFWKQNFYEGILPTQEINTDSQMYETLGNRYQRWQVWFEKPIGFRDYKSIPYLLELGHQYIEELDASDANSINKLVESYEIYS